jgi:AmiR/NasT family two-component response regulator
VPPETEVEIDPEERLQELQAELDGLRAAMRHRGVIEQAKGMLMVRLQLDEDTAFEQLRTLSNTANRKLSDVAADVVRTRAGDLQL